MIKEGNKFFSSCYLTLCLVFWLRLSDPFFSQRYREILCHIFLNQFWLVHKLFVSMTKF